MTNISPLTVTNPLGPVEGFIIRAVIYIAIFAGVFAWGIHKGEQHGYAKGHAEAVDVQARWDQDRARMAQAAATATEHHAQNEAAIAADKERIENDSRLKDQQLAAARADAAASHRSLLDAARAAAATSRGGAVDTHPGPLAGSGLPGVGTLDLPTGGQQPDAVVLAVLDGSDAATGDLALYADDLLGRLGACRAQYESVRTHSGD